MIKLIDVIFENKAKKDYINSIKEYLSEYSPTCSQDSDDSDFITIKLKDVGSGEPMGDFKRFVTNATLRKINIVPEKVKSIVDKHDDAFAKKHNLRIKGMN